MTIAVDMGRKATKTKQNFKIYHKDLMIEDKNMLNALFILAKLYGSPIQQLFFMEE